MRRPYPDAENRIPETALRLGHADDDLRLWIAGAPFGLIFRPYEMV
jgi:hypothetical protein